MITVVEPGWFTTVQDLGRSGLGHLGVPTAGAVDTFSLRIANRLVGNPDGAAALEMTGKGAVLQFETAMHVAIAGASCEVTVDGQPLSPYQTYLVPAGAVMLSGSMELGWRVYLAIGGGLTLRPVLGSVSSDTLSGLGPAPLVAGTRLPTAVQTQVPAYYMRTPPRYGDSVRLRILEGPQLDWFTREAADTLLQGEYRVLPQSDRAGVRLAGPVLARRNAAELPSMGMVAGALQVPRDGQPIALLANHGATGGYPVIANVMSADLGALAQLHPGAKVHFEFVTRTEALAALREQEERLERDIVAADATLLAARALMTLAHRHQSLKQVSISEGVRHISIRRGR